MTAAAEEQLETLERKMQTSESRRQIIEEYTGIACLNREITTKLIDYIKVGKRDPVTGQIPIEVHWNF